MTETEIAWLAGLLEGEGSFTYSVTHKRNSSGKELKFPYVKIETTDLDIVTRVHDIVGYGHRNSRKGYREHYKDVHMWGLTGWRAIELMKSILPYMGERRTNKINELLGYWESTKESRWKKQDDLTRELMEEMGIDVRGR